MQADINGPQRKILAAGARPLKPGHGPDGIAVRDGTSLPFVIERQWSAPAGYYMEQWFLVKPDTGEVFIEGPAKQYLILGLQARTELIDEVPGRFPLEPGSYQLVFALGGLKGGEVDVEVVPAPAEEAA
jgi:hypothetical protein